MAIQTHAAYQAIAAVVANPSAALDRDVFLRLFPPAAGSAAALRVPERSEREKRLLGMARKGAVYVALAALLLLSTSFAFDLVAKRTAHTAVVLMTLRVIAALLVAFLVQCEDC